MYKLMNSAMMPVSGTYRLKRITRKEFGDLLRLNDFESYIGYPDTAKIIEGISGEIIPISREQTTLENGDVMLICKLCYRVNDPNDKGKFVPSADDFEFYICEYASE